MIPVAWEEVERVCFDLEPTPKQHGAVLEVDGEIKRFDDLYSGLAFRLRVKEGEQTDELLNASGTDRTRLTRALSLLTTVDLKSVYGARKSFLIEAALFRIIDDSRVLVLPVANAKVDRDVFEAASHLAFFLEKEERTIVLPIFQPFAREWMARPEFMRRIAKKRLGAANGLFNPVELIISYPTDHTCTYSNNAWTIKKARASEEEVRLLMKDGDCFRLFKLGIRALDKTLRFDRNSEIGLEIAKKYMNMPSLELNDEKIPLLILFSWANRDKVSNKEMLKDRELSFSIKPKAPVASVSRVTFSMKPGKDKVEIACFDNRNRKIEKYLSPEEKAGMIRAHLLEV